MLEVTFAIWAGAVGVDHATNRDEIACLVLGNGRTDLGYTADDLVTRNNRILGRPPVATNYMDIGMADPAIQYIEQPSCGPMALR